MPTMYRQGDVLLVRTTGVDVGGMQEVVRDRGRVVLAYGEATGHAHALDDEGVTLYEESQTKARHLHIVRSPAALLHEEHAPIRLPPGWYRVKRQREYSPEEIRTVAD